MSVKFELPCRPERPLDSDCCGQGCVPCVLDLYEQELALWEEECCRIQTGETSVKDGVFDDVAPLEEQLSVKEYRPFTIETISPETLDTWRYRLALPKGATLGLRPGQHIVVRSVSDDQSITRQYTPVSDVNAKSYFELVIKVYEKGRMSQRVKSWTVGTKIDARGPFGNFIYKQNRYKRVLMLAVGTGIAPMCQVIQSILSNEQAETFIELLYGCRTYTDVLLKAEIAEWQRYWNFSSTFFLSQEKEESKHQYKYGDKIKQGRITENVLSAVIKAPLDDILVLICGTRSFEKDMIDAVTRLGVSKEQYHKF